jgi:REP element-mobilizing transposase RayT
MAHTYASNFIHCIFSTKDRRALIPPARTIELYAYLGAIARSEGFDLIAAGGTADHVHLLITLPATCALVARFRSSREVRPNGWVRLLMAGGVRSLQRQLFAA